MTIIVIERFLFCTTNAFYILKNIAKSKTIHRYIVLYCVFSIFSNPNRLDS